MSKAKKIYFINILSSGILACINWLSFKIWTQPPIGNSKEESIELLKQGIFEISMENLMWGILIISILIFLTGILLKRTETRINKKELIILFMFNLSLVCIGIIIGALDIYNALSLDIERNF